MSDLPRIYCIRPGQKPEVRRLGDDPSELRALLDNAAVSLIDHGDGLWAIVDHDSEAKKLPRCCMLWKSNVILCGPVIFCRQNAKREIVDLSDNDLALLQEHVEPWNWPKEGAGPPPGMANESM